ncbi:hypothetical protein COCON_G00216430 [Conger conger]|uniref:Uncharacterized protein n=1 Tax=Conger conger TaxID=82655 RepID=A0A9Q1CXU9_CONCO|nr:hypothetical protein COCON_G00216430 [Conger conger]
MLSSSSVLRAERLDAGLQAAATRRRIPETLTSPRRCTRAVSAPQDVTTGRYSLLSIGPATAETTGRWEVRGQDGRSGGGASSRQDQ